MGMNRQERIIKQLINSRKALVERSRRRRILQKAEAEGGCGVIGIACSEPIPGRHLLRSLEQMRNRGNGKGGGAALVGIEPASIGVTDQLLQEDYLLAVAYLDPSVQEQVERDYIKPNFVIDHVHRLKQASVEGLETPPPVVDVYFVRVRADTLQAFRASRGLVDLPAYAVEDELVYQTTYRLNRAFYASLGEKRAFVLSHGKDMLVLKMVGYGDDVIHVYQLEDVKAHVWIGHHRYPTKGRVWHPGGAHPFVGMHDALVHNGDFANYASVCTYLAQSNIQPLFLTDTEVSVLVFDLLYRTYGYPLEYVIEALAPTTERDFALLPESRREIYKRLQTVHMHGSPDGPWFFLIAQSARMEDEPRQARLIGITDTSMLRPQIFALQQGEPGYPSVGFAASEKQAIDAALASLASEDARFWTRPDMVWNARGGSHTDGGAFIFSVKRKKEGGADLLCQDKFGRQISLSSPPPPFRGKAIHVKAHRSPIDLSGSPTEIVQQVCSELPSWTYHDLLAFLGDLTHDLRSDLARERALRTLTFLIDRRYPTGNLRLSAVLSLCDGAIQQVFEAVKEAPSSQYTYCRAGERLPEVAAENQAVVIDATGFNPEGSDSLALVIQRLVERGFHRLLIAYATGQRFIGNGLGPETHGVRLDVYGTGGDYLASGIDGAEIVVHGSGQDQLAQIMKDGKLIVHGDVGQTFMYAAKGGRAFVRGNAAGRPLINAVGKPKVVINGTCLDYLAESFMAGDPFNGGGFVIVNGVTYDEDGCLTPLATPYPGGNLFSLASGGAIFVRDPKGMLGEEQLNGGEFCPFEEKHWLLIRPLLEENERLLGIPLSWLLEVEGHRRSPEEVYRTILPVENVALQPEEAWVVHEE
jgi:glutamate synthase domain-containing protein 1/glutamate synthase domain-containing protein 3